jgi:hypothetical protein
MLKAIALFITPCSSDPGFTRLGKDIGDFEIGVYKSVGKFMEDGSSEVQGDAEVGRGKINMFAFGGGDVVHALHGGEPVSSVVIFWFRVAAGDVHEFDVVVVDVDFGSSRVSAIWLSASISELFSVEVMMRSYGLAA